MIERAFPDTDAQTAALAALFARAIGGAVAVRGAASLVLTGGTTPGPLYDRLSRLDLPWDRVQATLSDERWVPIDQDWSNEHLVRTRLLRGPAAALRLVGLKTDDPSPDEAVAAVEVRLATLPQPFDLVLLGMGEDGHVASLFPGEPPVAQDRQVMAAVAPNGIPRLSLTLAVLADARRIALLVRGPAKRALLADVRAGAAPHLPVAALVARARCPVEVFWAP